MKAVKANYLSDYIQEEAVMAQKFTVILCDDEAAIISELQAAVDWEKLNIQIAATAVNGKEALDLIIRHMPDLAIMDICMPELDGLDAISRVKAAGINILSFSAATMNFSMHSAPSTMAPGPSC